MTAFESINQPREDGYPKVKELKAKVIFVSDAKDPNYDEPYSKLFKDYSV